LSDPDGKVCNAYGVIREKSMYGKLVKGIERSTFIIDAEGRIAKVYRQVKVAGHARAVLDDL
jgi:peroxiredoxin